MDDTFMSKVFEDPEGAGLLFCSNATPAIVVEQRTKVNKQGKNNEENARKSLQFAAPCLGLGGTAEHPVTGPQLPPLGSLGGVVVDGGVRR